MSKKYEGSSGGVGFIGLLTIALIVLKLTHVIDWSWWIVLAPLWGSLLLGLVLVVVVSIIFFFVKRK